MPLQPPATDFSDLPLHTKEVSVTSLKRVGRRNIGEPYFGRHAAYTSMILTNSSGPAIAASS